MAAHVDAFEELPEDERPDLAELETLGMPEQEITTTVDVRAFADRKRAAMAAHASQIGPESFFLAMPDEAFREAFGWEWFIHRPAAGDADGDLLAHLD
jgi:LmbE family N-acetylglucosaminyl deacetylase